MNLDRVFAVVGSALDSQRQRLNIIAGNLANAESTRSPNGGPYIRRDVVFETTPPEQPFSFVFARAFQDQNEPAGVRITDIIHDERPLRVIYDPAHPDADEKGYLHLPNVNPVEEMVNLISATRAYEANIAVMETGKTMTLRALQMGSS
ncbi:MAG: flagellar basal body rod protein FlgC [Nitrospirales bacterium]|nr:flagellar basal body rod protein FlgC [Nitrospirales bacterium]